MVGFILAIIADAVSIAITWSICSSKSNTNTGNQVSAASNTRITVTECTETGPMVYFADDRHGRSEREYRFNYKKVKGSWRAYILRMPNHCNTSLV